MTAVVVQQLVQVVRSPILELNARLSQNRIGLVPMEFGTTWYWFSIHTQKNIWYNSFMNESQYAPTPLH